MYLAIAYLLKISLLYVIINSVNRKKGRRATHAFFANHKPPFTGIGLLERWGVWLKGWDYLIIVEVSKTAVITYSTFNYIELKLYTLMEEYDV